MNPEQMQEMVREIYIMQLKAAWPFFAITGAQMLLSFALAWTALKHERGADRICWFLVAWIPLFGPLAFWFLFMPEIDQKNALNAGGIQSDHNPVTRHSPESMAWAKDILSKNKGKI